MLAIIGAFALFVAACAGAGDGSEVETASTPDETSTTVPGSSSTTAPPTTAPPTTAPPAAESSTPGGFGDPEPEATTGRTTYTVAPGDSLAAIAEAHGVRLEDLAAANGIADPNQIAAGQELTIPAPGETFEPPPPPESSEVAQPAPADAPPAPPAPPDAAPPPPPPEPPPPPPEPVANGADIYFNHCSGCHGDSGQGASGPALGGGAVVAKFPNAADQVAFVTNGGAAMPAYGGIISSAEIQAVVQFTRSL